MCTCVRAASTYALGFADAGNHQSQSHAGPCVGGQLIGVVLGVAALLVVLDHVLPAGVAGSCVACWQYRIMCCPLAVPVFLPACPALTLACTVSWK